MVLIIYLIIINLIGFSAMGTDKQYAKERKRRIPEKRLFTYSLIGGALGVWIGMRVWRHKTKHRSFTVGVPLLFAVNVVLVFYLAQTLN